MVATELAAKSRMPVTSMGFSMQPQLNIGDDRPMGPQQFTAWSAGRSTGPFDPADSTYASYQGNAPDYVIGTDWKRATSYAEPAAEPREAPQEIRVARITAFCVGAASIGFAIYLGPTVNAAFLVGLAFSVAASANLPVIVLSVFWKRFNTTGAVAGLATGLVVSIVLILLSPSGIYGKAAPFPLSNPGIVSIPLGFLAAWLGTLLSARDPEAEAKFAELKVRAHTGLGSEKATSH